MNNILFNPPQLLTMGNYDLISSIFLTLYFFCNDLVNSKIEKDFILALSLLSQSISGSVLCICARYSIVCNPVLLLTQVLPVPVDVF